MAATVLLALVLIEGALETFWRGSPIRWWVLVAVGGWAAAMIPAALFLHWGGRLWVTTLAAVGIIVFAVWRVAPNADPSLAVLTLPLAHVVPLLIVVALLLFGALVVRFQFVQRQPLLMAAGLLLTLYCLLPFGFAAVYGTPIDAVVYGRGYWTAPPLWLQGGFLALQVIVPLAVVLAAFAWLDSIAGRRRPGAAVLPAVSCLVFAATFAVGSHELARAGIPNLGSRYVPDWLPSAQTSPTGATAKPGAQESVGGIGPASATPGGQYAGAASPPAGAAQSASASAPSAAGRQPLGRGATTRGVALTVEAVEFASDVGGRAAAPGQMFVIVRTTWQNLIGLGTAGRTSATPYVVRSVHDQLWLLTDGRYADPIDETATSALDRHLPIGTLTVPAEGEPVTGYVAFRAPANASYLAIVLLDPVSGNALVSVKGRPVDAPPLPGLGPAASNDDLTVTITEAGWSDAAPAAPPGLRYFTIGLRAVGRAPDRLVQLNFADIARLQNDKGQVLEPQSVEWLTHPFARPAAILPGFPNEGQLAFLLPADSKGARFVLRPPSGGTIDIPVPYALGSPRPER